MSELSFHCRSCGSSAGRLVLDLGLQPLANNLLRPEDLAKPEPRFPLAVFVCPHCWLIQITEMVSSAELFSDYVYYSSFSETMLRYAREAACLYIQAFALGKQSLVIEIASNDGYLLRNFQEAGIPCLGIEPAANIVPVARQRGIETRVEFFTAELAGRLVGEGRQADLILGNNVFAHVPDTNDFVAGLRTLLKPGGRVVLEFPYAMDLVDKTEFDTIYHEHVFYFTLTALVPLFERQGLEIIDVERLAIHGGSLRIYVQHGQAQERRVVPSAPSPAEIHPGGIFGDSLLAGADAGRARVTTLLKEEHNRGMNSRACYEGFAVQVAIIRENLRRLIMDLRGQGNTIAAYGASAKGSTLLNYCGLDHKQIAFVADRSPYKQGRLTPGTHIPIVTSEALFKRMPDYTLLLTWNFAEEILQQQQAYRKAGGKFIIPIPEVRVT